MRDREQREGDRERERRERVRCWPRVRVRVARLSIRERKRREIKVNGAFGISLAPYFFSGKNPGRRRIRVFLFFLREIKIQRPANFPVADSGR